MDEERPNDIDILQLKKKKRSKSEKKKTTLAKSNPKSSNRSDVNSLVDNNGNKLNLNKGKNTHDNQENYNDNEDWNTMKSNLEKIQEVIINQESDILEAVTGCQEPNNYHIYGMRIMKKQMKKNLMIV